MIENPCVGVCSFDENRRCLGCKRTVSEIRQWWTMDEQEQKDLVADLAKR